MIVRISFLASAMLLLAGCDLATLEHDPKTVFDDPSAYRVSDELIEIIRAKDVERFLEKAHPDALSMEGFDQKMVEFYSHFPSDENFEIFHYYSELRKGDGEYAGIPVYLTAYDVVGEDEFSQLLLAVAPNEDQCCVATFWRITPSDMRPSTKYDFTLDGRSFRHYVFFGLLIFLPIFTLSTAVACGLNKHVKRKWIWIIFILVGLWGANFDWATGEIGTQFIQATSKSVNLKFLQFRLLGAGITKAGPFQPWVISIGIPVGAVLYWYWPARVARRRRKET